ncbi:DUF2270 domain-containing protein [Paracoccus alkenifer]|uniref:DUF2270 domain-containing protein n=1 Tax=Paracoccus alkenifer TaxID=65735 RepID=UPI003CCB7B4C
MQRLTQDSADDQPELRRFTPAELGALAHLYRGEIYRSTVWRTRLDTTTNWSVVTLGVALSITFSSRDASPLPLVLVGILILLFLALETRRYRYFNVWRARARWMEKHLYVPMLRDGVLDDGTNWQLTLADDYRSPRYHVSYLVAMSRRIRRNYLWILVIQSIAYMGKLVVHPGPVDSLAHFAERARIGPIPGVAVLAMGLAYITVFAGLAIWVGREDARRATLRGSQGPMG